MRRSTLIGLVLLVFVGLAPALQREKIEITHGPILGRPGAHHIGIWARTSRSGAFKVEYGIDPENLDRQSESAATSPSHDNTAWTLIRGLNADTKYYYRVTAIGENQENAGPVGSFRTLPDPDEFRDPERNPKGLFNFRFEFGCGNSQGSGPSNPPVFKTMREQLQENINFAILNGDWLYEERRDYPVNQWVDQVGIEQSQIPRMVRLAPTIVGVWENYKLYLERGTNLADWHRAVPSLFTFDDHEILNDVYGAGSIGLRNRRAVFRDIGVRAWYDYLGWSNPIEHTRKIHFGQARLQEGSNVLDDQEADFRRLDFSQMANLHVHWGDPTAGVNESRLDRTGGSPNAGVYEVLEVLGPHRLRIRPAAKVDGEVSYSIGQLSYYRMQVSNADFFFLDTRTHREMHDIDRPNKPGVSMIGEKQKSWLKEAMARSEADIFFVVSSVNFMIPHISCTGGNKDDAWTVFLQEREELIRFWDSLGKPVFILTGDLHNSFAIKITDRIWEFASGPHNSSNHRACDEGGRPANGSFDSRGRSCEIRWSSYFLSDVPRRNLRQPLYCVVQVNNVTNSPSSSGENRWVAFPHPQVVFQYYDGLTGKLLYAESILARR